MIENQCWNKLEYKKFIEYLKTFQDKKYKEFHSKLILNSKYEIIGIRVPIIRAITKQIIKTDYIEFLKYIENNYYEEVLIQGLVISHIKDEKIFFNYFKEYINKIDNWGICDSFCSSIKQIRKYEEKYFPLSICLSLNESEFISRIGLVLILNHFIKKDNLEIIFDTLNKINKDEYYINMAQAWLICDMYIKYPNETLNFIKENNLNKFTQNKAISKIHDSYRVSKENKEILNQYRK